MARHLPRLLLLLLSACAAESAAAPGIDRIQAAALQADLHFLAADGMRGRLVGTPEDALAAEYIKSRFERLRLSPVSPDGSFFQPFDLMTFSRGAENRMAIHETGGEPRPLAHDRDFFPLNFSASAGARGAMVYAGFGIAAPKLSYDDYQGQDLHGKIVLVLEHEPGERDPGSRFDGLVTSEPSVAWRK